MLNLVVHIETAKLWKVNSRMETSVKYLQLDLWTVLLKESRFTVRSPVFRHSKEYNWPRFETRMKIKAQTKRRPCLEARFIQKLFANTTTTTTTTTINIFFSLWRCSPTRAMDPSFLITNNNAPHSVGLFWTSDQFVAETSTWQHTTLTTDKHPCPRRDSNLPSQQASGRRTTP